MRRGRVPEAVAEAVIVLLALGLAFAAGVVGWVVGHETRPAGTAAVTATGAAAPAGHRGPNLPVAVIGDPVQGAQLWEQKRCADCHSYNGKGGTDAPPLDFMKGHLSAAEIANMSGQIWNHLPTMLHHFKEEHIPVPTFKGDEMADLIAYLHGSAD